ncbi:MAG: hypothetical protein P8075_03535 [Deltaproteobacteria bacterium]|jgi:hypothetical protein
MLRRWYLAVSLTMLASLLLTFAAVTGESGQSFRQENGLVVYTPPAWFLQGYFMAREKNPAYLFGPVNDFVRAVGGKTTWLIEDEELKRVEQATLKGERLEYSLFLEAVLPETTEYWVFVVLPYESGQEWFDARRAYHGRKAEAYYGKTRGELERALGQGFKVKGELRFFMEKGHVSLESPEKLIIDKYGFQPVFDLGDGRRLGSVAKKK